MGAIISNFYKFKKVMSPFFNIFFFFMNYSHILLFDFVAIL